MHLRLIVRCLPPREAREKPATTQRHSERLRRQDLDFGPLAPKDSDERLFQPPFQAAKHRSPRHCEHGDVLGSDLAYPTGRCRVVLDPGLHMDAAGYEQQWRERSESNEHYARSRM